MNISKTIIMPASPLRATVLLGSILSLVGTVQGALFWNPTTDFAATDTAPTGTTFTTQTFTPSGSKTPGSNHQAGDLDRTQLNFEGMNLNSGALQSLTGILDDGATGTNSRIIFQTTQTYTTGDILTFNFSYATQMVSQNTRTQGAIDTWNGSGVSDFGGDANLRFNWLIDANRTSVPNFGQPYSEVTWTIEGENVGSAASAGELNENVSSSFSSPDANTAIYTWSPIPNTPLADLSVVDTVSTNPYTTDDFAVESFSVSFTVNDANPFNAYDPGGPILNLAAGTEFIFTFDGISNGIEVLQTEVVPEPSGLLLLALGSLGLIARRKRRS